MMNNEKHVEILVPIDGPRRREANRNIGTFEERIALNTAALYVLNEMKRSGHFDDVDLDSLSTTILGFLREGGACLLGLCSYKRGNGNRRDISPGERTWRILVNRRLIHRSDGELEATIYHEFLHSILGAKENHGPVFQAYEALWPFKGGR